MCDGPVHRLSNYLSDMQCGSLSLSLPPFSVSLFVYDLAYPSPVGSCSLALCLPVSLSLSLSLCVSLSVSPCLSLFVSAKIEFRLPDTADKIPSMSLVKYAQKDRELQKDMSKPYRTM